MLVKQCVFNKFADNLYVSLEMSILCLITPGLFLQLEYPGEYVDKFFTIVKKKMLFAFSSDCLFVFVDFYT